MTSLPCVRTQRHLHTQKLLTFFGGKIQTPLFPPKIPTISDVPRGVHALRDFAAGWVVKHYFHNNEYEFPKYVLWVCWSGLSVL
jgi:hypothetical protein